MYIQSGVVVYDEQTGRGWINLMGPDATDGSPVTRHVEFQTPLPSESHQSVREREGWSKLYELERQIRNLVCDHEDHDDE